MNQTLLFALEVQACPYWDLSSVYLRSPCVVLFTNAFFIKLDAFFANGCVYYIVERVNNG